MNIKKCICLGLIVGASCSLFLVSCTSKNNVNSTIESSDLTLKDDEKIKIENEISESIIRQIKDQIKTDSQEIQRIPIINDTEYVYRNIYMQFNIKDNDDVNSQVNLSIDVDFLEPGQKCYADVYMTTECNGIKEIRYTSNLYENEMVVNKEYNIHEVEIIDRQIVSGGEYQSDYIKGIVKNTFNKDYSNAELRLTYTDKEGIVNSVGSFTISEFIAGESYHVEIGSYLIGLDEIIKDSDNLKLKIYLKE